MAQLSRFIEYKVIDNFESIHAPEIDKTAFCEENDVSTRLHREAIHLRLNVNHLLGICLQPGYVNLNIEMADTIENDSQNSST